MSIHSVMARQSLVTSEVSRPHSKRERILRAAIDVFAQSGYFNAKVSEIARAAGVADGTIYLYFDGKEDLLISIFREHTRNYLQSLERDLANVNRPEDRMRITIRHHLSALGREGAVTIVAEVELRHSVTFVTLMQQQEYAEHLKIHQT